MAPWESTAALQLLPVPGTPTGVLHAPSIALRRHVPLLLDARVLFPRLNHIRLTHAHHMEHLAALLVHVIMQAEHDLVLDVDHLVGRQALGERVEAGGGIAVDTAAGATGTTAVGKFGSTRVDVSRVGASGHHEDGGMSGRNALLALPSTRTDPIAEVHLLFGFEPAPFLFREVVLHVAVPAQTRQSCLVRNERFDAMGKVARGFPWLACLWRQPPNVRLERPTCHQVNDMLRKGLP